MMRVKVLPPAGCDRSRLDEKSWMEIPEGSDIEYVLNAISLSKLKAKLLLVSVNGERAKLNQKLNDGDVVGFFIPVTGG